MASTTKADLIAKYGEQWYEDFKARSRKQSYARYHADIEKARKRGRDEYQRNKPTKQKYAVDHRDIYRINSRDTNRLRLMGLLKEGYEVHHFKYHSDKKDASWIDDIAIMTREEHSQWHREHPDFCASDNIV